MPLTPPPLASLAFIIPLFAQCFLLHPSIPSNVSNPIRHVLLLPTLYLIYLAPLEHLFEPRNQARALNATWGIFTVYSAWKCLEWGLVRDRSVYEWVGFDEKKEEGSEGAGKDDQRNGHTLIFAHAILVLSMALISTPYHDRLLLIYRLTSALDASSLGLTPFHQHVITETLAYMAFALLAYSGILTSYTLVLLTHAVFFPSSFDPREYAPLFHLPFWPKSVTLYWSRQWHGLFRRPFRVIASGPTEMVVRPIFGRGVAKAMGVMAVFALTAAGHEYAIYVATRSLPSPPVRDTFLSRYGATLFFLLMGLATITEQIFTYLTGRRVGGFLGLIWMVQWQIPTGLLLYSAW
ncbi:hypothetical protein MNV49_001286 [Pseudohyphozyma bogoriensis]|nr:hypothetical protein MNV49_001286 [Pseudohyphozyma bogoriensis]